MRYKVKLRFSEEGVSASALGLPGCHSQGVDEAEAMANIAEAIREYLEVREEMAREAEGEPGAVEVREVEVAV